MPDDSGDVPDGWGRLAAAVLGTVVDDYRAARGERGKGRRRRLLGWLATERASLFLGFVGVEAEEFAKRLRALDGEEGDT